jgi:hypothetical protein
MRYYYGKSPPKNFAIASLAYQAKGGALRGQQMKNRVII